MRTRSVFGLIPVFLILEIGRLTSSAMARAPDSTNPVADLVLAAKLAERAEAQRDPLAMLVAAGIFRGLQPTALKPRPGSQMKLAPTGMTPAGTGPQLPALPDSHALLDRAESFAQGRTDILALIKEARDAGARGVVGTVGAMSGQLRAKEVRNLWFDFTGDEDAAVAVTRPKSATGPDTGDIDLLIADQRGTPVCVSETPGTLELCQWTPRKTGAFQIRIENRLASPADFVLIVR